MASGSAAALQVHDDALRHPPEDGEDAGSEPLPLLYCHPVVQPGKFLPAADRGS